MSTSLNCLLELVPTFAYQLTYSVIAVLSIPAGLATLWVLHTCPNRHQAVLRFRPQLKLYCIMAMAFSTHYTLNVRPTFLLRDHFFLQMDIGLLAILEWSPVFGCLVTGTLAVIMLLITIHLLMHRTRIAMGHNTPLLLKPLSETLILILFVLFILAFIIVKSFVLPNNVPIDFIEVENKSEYPCKTVPNEAMIIFLNNPSDWILFVQNAIVLVFYTIIFFTIYYFCRKWATRSQPYTSRNEYKANLRAINSTVYQFLLPLLVCQGPSIIVMLSVVFCGLQSQYALYASSMLLSCYSLFVSGLTVAANGPYRNHTKRFIRRHIMLKDDKQFTSRVYYINTQRS